MFTKVGTLSKWTIGSIVSDTGSEYSFGFNPSDEEGLLWLERSGVSYTPADSEWREARRFIRASLNLQGQEQAPVNIPQVQVVGPVIDEALVPQIPDGIMGVPPTPSVQVDHGHSHGLSDDSRPKTVSRSASSSIAPILPPGSGDSRIVGDVSSGGTDIPDDAIAERAASLAYEELPNVDPTGGQAAIKCPFCYKSKPCGCDDGVPGSAPTYNG